MSTSQFHAKQRGVTLIEALVAMAVMAFGMLAIVGVQSTLRVNADVARERAEATRLAEQQLELARGFTSVGDTPAPATDFDSIATSNSTLAADPSVGRTTNYTVETTVNSLTGGLQKSIKVKVSWADRYGTDRSVVLRDIVTRSAPALSGIVSSVKTLTVVGQRKNRHPTIPVDAVNLGNPQNESAFQPPSSGSVAWVFNNVTGVITRVCNVSLTVCEDTNAQLLSGYVRFNLRGVSKVINSSNDSAYKPVPGDIAAYTINGTSELNSRCSVPAGTASKSLVEGDLSTCATISPSPSIAPFDLAEPAGYALVESDAENPKWPALNLKVGITHDSLDPEADHRHAPECFSDAPTTSVGAVTQAVVQYFCIIHPKTSDGKAAWIGRSDLIPLGFTDGSGSPTPIPWPIGATENSYRVCRYTTSSSEFAANTDHPATYGRWISGCTKDGAGGTDKCRPVTGNLINQNFLVIEGSKTCPTDSAVSPSNLQNTNTLQHQP